MDATRIQTTIEQSEFRSLFVEELGWDKHIQRISVRVYERRTGKVGPRRKSEVISGKYAHRDYVLEGLAQKRGVVIFSCQDQNDELDFDSDTRRKIALEVTKHVREHLVIFTDASKSNQTWQWIRQDRSKGLKLRERTFCVTDDYTDFIEQLRPLAFTIDEEDNLTLVRVLDRMQQAFDVALPTKQRGFSLPSVDCSGLNFEQAILAMSLHVLLAKNSSHNYAPPIRERGWSGKGRDYWNYSCQNCRKSISNSLGLCRECKHHLLRYQSAGGVQRLPGFFLAGWRCCECERLFYSSGRDSVALLAHEREYLSCPWCKGASSDLPVGNGPVQFARSAGWTDGFRPFKQNQPASYNSLRASEGIEPFSFLASHSYPNHPGTCYEWAVTMDYLCPCCGEFVDAEFALCDTCQAALFRGEYTRPYIDELVVRVWHCHSCTLFSFTPIWESDIPDSVWWQENEPYLFCVWCGEETDVYPQSPYGTSYQMRVGES